MAAWDHGSQASKPCQLAHHRPFLSYCGLHYPKYYCTAFQYRHPLNRSECDRVKKGGRNALEIQTVWKYSLYPMSPVTSTGKRSWTLSSLFSMLFPLSSPTCPRCLWETLYWGTLCTIDDFSAWFLGYKNKCCPFAGREGGTLLSYGWNWAQRGRITGNSRAILFDLNRLFTAGKKTSRIWIANKTKGWLFTSGVLRFKAHSVDACRWV